MTFLIISFLGGVLTVLAPCVLPLLPVIVGGSLTEKNPRRTAVIVTSLGISIMAFTFILKVSTLFIMIPQSVWEIISGGIILIFGIVTLFPGIWEHIKFVNMLNRSSNKMLGKGYMKQSFWGDVIIGASLGPVFSSCSPTYFLVLASVLPQSPIVGFFDLLAYTFGLCLMLLLIAHVGQKVLDKLNIATDPKGWFKRTLGVIFIIVGILILTGTESRIETALINSGVFDITKVEQKLIGAASSDNSSVDSTGNTNRKGPQPELVNPSGFVNTDGKPITINQFRGKKVVLLDIWTYSCINCQRTIPYLNAWYKKYADQGLEIIGIHTPEFSFEKVQKNVEDATKRFGIKYPVVLDNNYATWNALGNQYWPRKYLIDSDGYVIYDHIGEGNYDVTEKAIQKALADLHKKLGDMSTSTMDVLNGAVVEPQDAISLDAGKVGSPEIYFGAARNEYLGNGRVGSPTKQVLKYPSTTEQNGLYLSGTWNFSSEFATNETEAAVLFKYSAKNVYIVASTDPAVAPDGTEIEIYRDGQKIQTILIKEERLYQLVNGSDYGAHTLEIKIKKPGLKAFTFTFG